MRLWRELSYEFCFTSRSISVEERSWVLQEMRRKLNLRKQEDQGDVQRRTRKASNWYWQIQINQANWFISIWKIASRKVQKTKRLTWTKRKLVK